MPRWLETLRVRPPGRATAKVVLASRAITNDSEAGKVWLRSVKNADPIPLAKQTSRDRTTINFARCEQITTSFEVDQSLKARVKTRCSDSQ